MIRLKIRDSYFKVIDGYRVNESSREVKFSSLTIDFTDRTIANLPLKYQEVQLVKLDDDYNITNIIYTGYVNNFVLPKMKNRNEYRELEIDLLSPLAMATIRTVDAVGTYKLQALVRELIQPLIDDGFVLKDFNIGNNQVTVNFLSETVESSLNKLSNKHNFWWYIDENKNIYINNISYLMSIKPKLVYDNYNSIKGLIDFIPSIDATDYCNVINFTNVRVYTESTFFRFLDSNEIGYNYYNPIIKIDNINIGKEIEFDIPIVLNINDISKANKNALTIFTLTEQGGYNDKIRLSYDANGKLVLPNNVTIESSYSDNAEWVLVRDAFFSNLIVGLQYNGSSFDFGGITSDFALMWSKVKVADEIEINKNKGIISQSGIVEKQIDMNEQWKTYEELIDIASSYTKKNVSVVDQVKLNVDYDIGLEIGNTVEINKNSFLVNGTFIITDKTTIYDNNVNRWEYTLKNTNILENYVDLFRATETEEQTDKQYVLMTSNYIEEGIKESYEVLSA